MLKSECFDELWLLCAHSLREDPAFQGIAKDAILYLIDNFDKVRISKSFITLFLVMQPCFHDFVTDLDMSRQKDPANQGLEHFPGKDALDKELAHDLLEAVIPWYVWLFSSTFQITNVLFEIRAVLKHGPVYSRFVRISRFCLSLH
jgi:hypothetical protein